MGSSVTAEAHHRIGMRDLAAGQAMPESAAWFHRRLTSKRYPDIDRMHAQVTLAAGALRLGVPVGGAFHALVGSRWS